MSRDIAHALPIVKRATAPLSSLRSYAVGLASLTAPSLVLSRVYLTKPPANQLHHKMYLITYLLSVPNGTRGPIIEHSLQGCRFRLIC